MSGTLNPMIYALANKPTVQIQSPIEMLGGAAGTVNALNQNRLFQSQVAAGQALQQSIDPTTGMPDTAQYNRLIAANPQAALAAPQAVNQAQNLSAAQSALATQQRMAAARDTAGLLSLPDDQLNGGGPIFQYLGSLRDSGAISPQAYQTYTQNLPPPGAPAGAFRQALISHLAATLGGQEAINAVVGSPGQMDNGLSVQPGMRGGVLNPNGGPGFTPAGPETPVYPSRAQQATPFNIQTPTGAPAITTTGAAVTAAGGGSLLGPPDGTVSRLPPALLPPGYNGGYPGRGGAPAQPGTAPAPQTGLQPGPQASVVPTPQNIGGMPAVPVGPAPGVVEAARATAQSNVEQAQSLQTSSDQSPNRQAMLGNMITDLQNFTPGPGNSIQNHAQSLAQRLAPGISEAFGLDPQKVASAESFDKLATNLAQQQAGALGSGTNLQLETASHGNPNSSLSKLGATQIIQMLQGNEDAIQAKNQAWQTYKQTNGAASYGDFSTQFNKTFDPRAFQMMRMAPADRARLIASIPGDPSKPGTEAYQFRQKFNTMVSSGLIPDPRQTAAPAPAPVAAPVASASPPDVPSGY